MKRHARLEALLTSIMMWAGAFCFFGFGCVIVAVVAHNSGFRYPDVLIATTVLPTVAAGLVSILALALRGAMEARWRFSLADLLVVTTVTAVTLALFVAMLRGS